MITVNTIKDSIYKGSRITTLELEYPRFIHAEFMTHRLFSRNAASSRAIPCKTMRRQVWNEPAMPVHWGANQAGMKASQEVSLRKKRLMRFLWRLSGKGAVIANKLMSLAGLHKQLANRVLEPWQMIKVVVTSTEWENFLWLRDHEDAQPEIADLARQIKEEMNFNTPEKLELGEWHLPYFDGGKDVSLEDAKAVSVSCCAQVSYRKTDTSIKKARRINEMLVSGQRIHASPFEHQARPICGESDSGVTHLDIKQRYWSGNLCGWVQHRQLISGHAKG